MAVFRSRGTVPVVRDALMMFVMVGKRNVIGIGSSSETSRVHC